MRDFVERTNTRDNHRVWHAKVAERNGVYLWVGDELKKLPLWGEAGNLYYTKADQSEIIDSLANARTYFTRTHDNYLTGKNSDQPLHPIDRCGGQWLGIAQAPLPKDWYLPTSKWSGWTHLMHWQLGRDDYDPQDYKIPPPTAIFEYVRYILKGYPPDLTQYSQELVNTFNLNEIKPERLAKHFPWLDPRMALKRLAFS